MTILLDQLFAKSDSFKTTACTELTTYTSYGKPAPFKYIFVGKKVSFAFEIEKVVTRSCLAGQAVLKLCLL